MATAIAGTPNSYTRRNSNSRRRWRVCKGRLHVPQSYCSARCGIVAHLVIHSCKTAAASKVSYKNYGGYSWNTHTWRLTHLCKQCCSPPLRPYSALTKKRNLHYSTRSSLEITMPACRLRSQLFTSSSRQRKQRCSKCKGRLRTTGRQKQGCWNKFRFWTTQGSRFNSSMMP